MKKIIERIENWLFPPCSNTNSHSIGVDKMWKLKLLLAEQSQVVAEIAQIANLPTFDPVDINNRYSRYKATQRQIIVLLNN